MRPFYVNTFDFSFITSPVPPFPLADSKKCRLNVIDGSSNWMIRKQNGFCYRLTRNSNCVGSIKPNFKQFVCVKKVSMYACTSENCKSYELMKILLRWTLFLNFPARFCNWIDAQFSIFGTHSTWVLRRCLKYLTLYKQVCGIILLPIKASSMTQFT